MSATTIAVATMTETEEPAPRSRPGHAALPASDAAMSVRASGSPPGFHGAGGCRRVQAALTSVKIGWLIRYLDTYWAFVVRPWCYGIVKTWQRSHNRDTIACSPKHFRMGSFSGSVKLTPPKHQQAQIRSLRVELGIVGG